MHKAIVAITLPALVALAACGSNSGGSQAGDQDSAEDAANATPSLLASAPAAFGQCASCHSLEAGKHGIGPSLHGITGTKAGDIPGYNFSPALKASGLVWDDATLDNWLAAPMEMVPGTKMTYAGLSDPAKRKELIAFLKTVK
jgi:Cytochrome c2